MRIAPEIDLSARQRQVLEHLVRSPTVEQRLVQRARIVLAAAGGGLNRDLAKDLGVDAGTVGRWRRRWAAAQERLRAAEESASASPLRRCVTETLVDARRSGWPGIFMPPSKSSKSSPSPASLPRPRNVRYPTGPPERWPKRR